MMCGSVFCQKLRSDAILQDAQQRTKTTQLLEQVCVWWRGVERERGREGEEEGERGTNGGLLSGWSRSWYLESKTWLCSTCKTSTFHLIQLNPQSCEDHVTVIWIYVTITWLACDRGCFCCRRHLKDHHPTFSIDESALQVPEKRKPCQGVCVCVSVWVCACVCWKGSSTERCPLFRGVKWVFFVKLLNLGPCRCIYTLKLLFTNFSSFAY